MLAARLAVRTRVARPASAGSPPPSPERTAPHCRCGAGRRQCHARGQRLASLLVSDTSQPWAGASSIQIIAAPSASHPARTASSPQLTTAGLPIGGIPTQGQPGLPGYVPNGPTHWYIESDASNPRTCPCSRPPVAKPDEPGNQHRNRQSQQCGKCQAFGDLDCLGICAPPRNPEVHISPAVRLGGDVEEVASVDSSRQHPQHRQQPGPAADPQAPVISARASRTQGQLRPGGLASTRVPSISSPRLRRYQAG